MSNADIPLDVASAEAHLMRFLKVEGVTGKEAFHRETAMKTLLAVVSDEPGLVTTVNPFVPDDVAAVVARCLTKDPANRYFDAADLDHAFAACTCDGKWDESRATEWWDQHPHADPGTGTDLNSLPLGVAKAG